MRFGFRSKENEVNPIRQMKPKNNDIFDTKRRENEVDPIEPMKQNVSGKFDSK